MTPSTCTCLPFFPSRQALFSAVSTDFFARVALGLGETRHPPQPPPGEVGRKGISHECTFRHAG